MDTHDPTDPNRPPEGDQPREQPPADEGTTQQQPQSPAEGQVKREQPQSPADEQTTREQPQSPAAEQEPVRRLYRSRSDRVLAGVARGLGRYFGVDPLIFRIVLLVLAFAGAGAWHPPLPRRGAADAERARARRHLPAQGARLEVESLGLTAVILVIVLRFTWPFLLGGRAGGLPAPVPIAFLALVGLAVGGSSPGEPPAGSGGHAARRIALGLGVPGPLPS